jgi:hypothetical protein
VASSVALIVGIVVSSVFGLYFPAAIGVHIGTVTGSQKTPEVVLAGTGDKPLRGLDVSITALIIPAAASSCTI